MSALEQLEQQVLELSPEDLSKFRAWFIELDHQLWDKQIEADSTAGKLDRLIEEEGDINWIWIGTHAEYDKLIS